MKRVTLKKREMSYAMTEELNTLRTNIQFSGVDKKVIVMNKQFLRRRKVYDYLISWQNLLRNLGNAFF